MLEPLIAQISDRVIPFHKSTAPNQNLRTQIGILPFPCESEVAGRMLVRWSRVQYRNPTVIAINCVLILLVGA
jgi:hypothetical protein